MGIFGSWFGSVTRRTPAEVVEFYRGLGFFSGDDPGSRTEAVLRKYEDEHGEPLDPSKAWDDVWLLSLDSRRVWSEDPECDVCPENRVYVEVLKEWGKLAGPVFAPEQVDEVWAGPEGPVEIRLSLGGAPALLSAEGLDDYLDLNVLGGINRLIAGSGKQFACASDVNFAVVFLADEAAIRTMARERRFPFLRLR